MNLKFLIDLIPAKARKYVYAILTIVVFIYGVWQAAGGDWGQFIVSLVTSAVGTLATANTDVDPEDRPEEGE